MRGTVACISGLSKVWTAAPIPNMIDRFFQNIFPSGRFRGIFRGLPGADMVLRGCVGADTRKRRITVQLFAAEPVGTAILGVQPLKPRYLKIRKEITDLWQQKERTSSFT